jgi:two-component system, cell cycle response regulator DivK
VVKIYSSRKKNEKDIKMNEIKKPLILIAEDEDSNYTVLKMLLERKLNAEVVRARDGLEAVELTRTNANLSLVLMDIKMPVMDGFEATGIIKTERKELPIIAITAYGLSGDEHKALSAGCDDYVSKPIQTTILFEKIKFFLNIA